MSAPLASDDMAWADYLSIASLASTAAVAAIGGLAFFASSQFDKQQVLLTRVVKVALAVVVVAQVTANSAAISAAFNGDAPTSRKVSSILNLATPLLLVAGLVLFMDSPSGCGGFKLNRF
jgi:cbb3-type cytochrome oxidase subunit 1